MKYSASRKLSVALLVTASWVFIFACGGGGGGGGGSTPLPASGPGDPQNIFPFLQGSRWIFRVAEESAGSPVTVYYSAVRVSGTTVFNGVPATLFTEYDPDGIGGQGDSILAKDDRGVRFLGSNFDHMAAAVAPYQLVAFPTQPGTGFVQYDVRGLGFGEDIDGDGLNETFAATSRVDVLSPGSVTVQAGVFDNCVVLRTTGTLSVTLSLTGTVVRSTITETAWYAAGIGLAKRVTVVAFDTGETQTTTETLAGYSVDGREAGLPRPVAGNAVLPDNVAVNAGRLYSVPVSAGTRYSVSLSGATDNVGLLVYDGTFAVDYCSNFAGGHPAECVVTPVGAELQAIADGAAALSGTSAYAFLTTPVPNVPAPVPEGSSSVPVPVSAGTPTIGQVGTRATSYYATEGLDPGIPHTVTIVALTDAADLHVYADNVYAFERDCTLRSFGARECTVDGVGSLYFSVSSGALNRTGAAYVILTR